MSNIRKKLLVATLITLIGPCVLATDTLPNVFTPGMPIESSKVNENFMFLYKKIEALQQLAEKNAVDHAPVAHWSFSGNANDVSGNGNAGTVNGATLTSDRFGHANSAYSFDGNDYIAVRENSNFDFTGSFSYVAWVQTSGPPNPGWGQGVIGRAYFPAPSSDAITLTTMIWNDTKSIGGVITNSSGSPFYAIGGSGKNGIWQMIVMKYDYSSGLFSTFIDGVKTAEVNAGKINLQQDRTAIDPLFIGCYHGNSGPCRSFFYGKIDDVRVFKRALSDTEITALFHSEKPKD